MDRRSALVEGAFRLIAEKGFEGLRLREVAAEAGIDHSSLHHHFSTKADLVAAVVAHTTGQLRELATPNPADPPTDRLRTHLQRLALTMTRCPELFIVARELDLRATRDPALATVLREHESGWRAALADRLADLDGARSGTGVASAVELVIATVKGVSFTPATAPAVVQELLRLLAGPGPTRSPRERA